jgi:hypothetical protein
VRETKRDHLTPYLIDMENWADAVNSKRPRLVEPMRIASETVALFAYSAGFLTAVMFFVFGARF